MKAFVATIMMCMACASPRPVFGDVAPLPDTSSEDLAGVALIGANMVLATQLGIRLQRDAAGATWGWLGTGFGLASIALGVTETTSFSGAVALAGSVTTILGVMHLVRPGEPAGRDGADPAISRSLSISPLVTSSDKPEHGFGVLVRAAF